MGKRGMALPIELYHQARQMYAEKDERGFQRWSMRDVAKFFGISETSVLRAVHNQGRFGNIEATPLPPTRTEEMWAKDVEASKKKFLAVLEEQRLEALRPRKMTGMEAFDADAKRTAARAIPPSPLDGGDAPSESDGTGLTKLVQVMKAGDVMLEELAQEVNQPEKKDE